MTLIAMTLNTETASQQSSSTGPVVVCSHFTQGHTPFMKFWKVMNDILESRGAAPVLYGEARDWFQQSDL